MLYSSTKEQPKPKGDGTSSTRTHLHRGTMHAHTHTHTSTSTRRPITSGVHGEMSSHRPLTRTLPSRPLRVSHTFSLSLSRITQPGPDAPLARQALRQVHHAHHPLSKRVRQSHPEDWLGDVAHRVSHTRESINVGRLTALVKMVERVSSA